MLQVVDRNNTSYNGFMIVDIYAACVTLIVLLSWMLISIHKIPFLVTISWTRKGYDIFR